MKTARLIIVGCGAIGRGLLETILKKQDSIRREFDVEFKIVAVCEVNGSVINPEGIDAREVLNLAGAGKLDRHTNWGDSKSLEAIKGTEADIVVELTPGNVKTGEPGLSHIMAALESEKHVVTSNKAPIALKFNELMEMAKKRGLELRYEATVGGAIPIFNLKDNCLQVNKVKSVYGILNGTSNFILTKMAEEGVSLETALKEAQEIGIAETDASYDIDGIDSALKLTILANSLIGKQTSFEDVSVDGIRDINADTIELAKKHGNVIRLVGDSSSMKVAPMLIPETHPLNIRGSLNAVMLETDIAKDIIVIGRGAGPEETSSSILSDILNIARNL